MGLRTTVKKLAMMVQTWRDMVVRSRHGQQRPEKLSRWQSATLSDGRSLIDIVSKPNYFCLSTWLTPTNNYVFIFFTNILKFVCVPFYINFISTAIAFLSFLLFKYIIYIVKCLCPYSNIRKLVNLLIGTCSVHFVKWNVHFDCFHGQISCTFCSLVASHSSQSWAGLVYK